MGMTNEDQRIEGIQKRLAEAETSEEGLTLLQEVFSFTEEFPTKEAYYLVAQVFRMLRTLTNEEPEEAASIVTQELVPWLLLPDLPESASSVQRDCRILLREWINQYPDPVRGKLLQSSLDGAGTALRKQPAQAICWVISMLGYRRSDIVAELFHLAKQYDDELGDTALRTLVSLGVHGSERQEVLDELHRRITIRQNVPLLGGISDLADVTTLPVLTHGLRHSFSAGDHSPLTRTLVLNMLVDIADAHVDDKELQHSIWDTLVSLHFSDQEHGRSDIYLGSQMAPRCNDPRVPQQLLEWLDNHPEDTDQARHMRYLLYLRFLESVRPQHLQLLPTFGEAFPPQVLYQDARQDTGNTGLWATSAMYAKERAWNVLLNLGDATLLREDMFQASVVQERSGFVRKEMMELLACFHWKRLPGQVLAWITERIDLAQETLAHELAFRRAAECFAQSAQTREAFDAFLAFGMTYQGETLRETAHALTHIAAGLVKRGEPGIIESLIAAFARTNEERYRLVALQALMWLAQDMPVPQKYLPTLLAAVHEPERTDLERGYVIQILGEVSSSVSIPNLRELLEGFAETRSSHTGRIALEELVHTGMLRSTPHLLEKYLPLYRVGTQWDCEATSRLPYETVGLICSLYRQAPQDFLPAIATLLDKSEGSTLSLLLETIKAMSGGDSRGVPHEIRRVLRSHLKNISQRRFFDHSIELLKVAAILIPETFIAWPWEAYENSLDPQARATLAKALQLAMGTCRTSRERPLTTSQSISHLLRLAGDTQYEVRRAVYRSLAHVAPETLLQLGMTWASAPALEGRRRAAEVLTWLPLSTACSIAPDVLRTLRDDPEPLVRETVEREQRVQQRRRWADDYLRHVRNAYGKSNQQRLHAWRYAHALARVGDDATIAALQIDLEQRQLAPYERQWLIWILKNLQEQWRKTAEKWPKSWFPWGRAWMYEQGHIVCAEQRKVPGTFCLYPEDANDPGRQASWLGTFLPESPFLDLERRGRVELSHSRRGEVQIDRHREGAYWHLHVVFEQDQ